MRLGEVMTGAPTDVPDVEISGLAYDNRAVTPGTLFFCVPGFTRDGHEFAADAVRRGAVALVVERPVRAGVPEVLVGDVRAAMAPAAARFYGDPTSELAVAGVTGTNGKTTTAFLIRAVLEADGRQTGLLGTVTSLIGGRERSVERTTPEAIDLQRTFREMRDGGDVACAMEVSSHALALRRADAIHFAVAIFTNLTQDHLDFHPTMEDYFQAKRRLFTDAAPAHAVINRDDPYGARLAAELASATTFGLSQNATYRAAEVETGLHGSRFTIVGPDGSTEMNSPLRGRFNVYNVVGAFAAVRALGVEAEVAAKALAEAELVPGRFQPVEEGQEFAVLVDYAHTPDSLQNVLEAARELTPGRLHVVFGCGGDRDPGKRPLMGQIARALADRVIVTSDNPRSEDPEAIIDEILTGSGSDVEHLVDRREAIEQAIAAARPGDVVVIAGKGHEQGQEFEAGRRIPFDDATVAREVLRGAALAR
ncbi:MAG TPA: UDP-N-acetylmuramoyl-L-alanyl-D-glutamate--2,6-diaminopimelate ligase [Solirubrobacteraceae bacterium]|nr:UDP-N-acetylmuramoyl-L-alanyl-D-glutamate--2,6-diaminopimelate ligase [Solirubrobacteraceae bacterium]